MKDKDDPVDKLSDILDTANDLIDSNRDIIETAVDVVSGDDSGSSEFSVAELDELSEIRSTDEFVEIVAETKMDGINELTINQGENRIEIVLDDKQIVANDMPSDLDISETEASLNNGVLTVRVPRSGGMDGSVNRKDGEL